MAIANTFRELAVDQATTQAGMVDALLEEAPILAGLPMEASSHGLQNVYEELVSADSAQAVDLDEALPEVDASSKLKSVDLRVLGARITVGEDKAKKYGGAANYFNAKYPAILKKTGADMERAILYNSFRAYALANHTAGDPRVISVGGDTVGACWSIIAVHFAPGEITGLYDPEGFGNGKAFDIMALNNGALYPNAAGVLVYGARLKTYFGLQLANAQNVSALVNIDFDHLPTAAMLDALIDNCRGRPENTLLMMHPTMKSRLQDIKGGMLDLVVGDKNIDRRFLTWGGVEIADSYNFLKGTEAIVTVA